MGVDILLIGFLALIGSANGNSFTLGSFSTLAHVVSGTVEAIGPNRLRILNFNYDGFGPDAFFWAGFEGTAAGDSPDSSGMIIPVEPGNEVKLDAYNNVDVILTLPDGLFVYNIKWLSVWCRAFAANFGSLIFPGDFENSIPKPAMIGQFSSGAHAVSSGEITILDTRTFRISLLYYDGTAPSTFFLVGTGSPNAGGTKVPDENGSLENLSSYSGQTITIRLPEGMAMKDINWLSIYCTTADESFGSVTIPANPFVPLYVEEDKFGPLPHCQQMSDRLNVAWNLQGSNLILELIGALETNEYMSFGMSGGDGLVQMVDAQVVVATVDNLRVPQAKDYKLTAKSFCAGTTGACPVTELGETDQVTLISSSVRDGVTRVRVSRPIWRTDVTSFAVVWAIGPFNRGASLVTYHSPGASNRGGLTLLTFGRGGSETCPSLSIPEKPDLPAWPALMLGPGVTSFEMTIGPSGGTRGYTGITGKQSWGIAWYPNAQLIPEIKVTRGQTYTFRVSGGNNPTESAKYHPFYLTDSAVGGKNGRNTGEKIFQLTDTNGQKVDMGVGPFCEYTTPSDVNPDDYDNFPAYATKLTKACESGSPGEYTWTPDSSTPDLIYYQCYTHQYLGWKITVSGGSGQETGNSGTTHITSHPSTFILLFVITVFAYWSKI